MRRVESVGDLAQQRQRAAGVERPLVHQRRERGARHQPHRQEEPVLGLAGLEDGHDVGMLERRLQPALASEARDELGIALRLAREHLQRDPAPCSTCRAL